MQYGYRTTPELMALLQQHEELKHNLSAVAHLVHGSSEGRFRVTYATNPSHGGLTREEVEGVGYGWMDYQDAVSFVCLCVCVCFGRGWWCRSVDQPINHIHIYAIRSSSTTRRSCSRATTLSKKAGRRSILCRRPPWACGPPRRASNVGFVCVMCVCNRIVKGGEIACVTPPCCVRLSAACCSGIRHAT